MERAAEPRTSVVVITYDRRSEVLVTLGHLAALPERPPVVLVDNGSSDGTLEAVRSSFPGVEAVRLEQNIGAAARNIGVRAATTPYVAFADDDSWWAPGALSRAADHFDSAPRLAFLQARILVGPDERIDPMCTEMAASPLPRQEDLPGPPLLGFIACGTVVRRDAFLELGGFDDLLFFLGEEMILAQDAATAGWGIAYVDDVVAHHHPSPIRDVVARRRRVIRNDLLSTWMRRPYPVVVRATASVGARALVNPAARGALAEAARRWPEARRRRRVLPPRVERMVRLLETAPST
ncbi:MAG: putative transferase [uncultured Acidimicrobiales bacterium]|uniref:Putative transferase n=1 Tax=uncultured Acidimicrobiales bacterium TaxID=310071 RepID=A0A6J4I8N3_9ACTN|nr:MAG: putative transferase [uncultured Acidimicrobiales bacterium]